MHCKDVKVITNTSITNSPPNPSLTLREISVPFSSPLTQLDYSTLYGVDHSLIWSQILKLKVPCKVKSLVWRIHSKSLPSLLLVFLWSKAVLIEAVLFVGCSLLFVVVLCGWCEIGRYFRLVDVACFFCLNRYFSSFFDCLFDSFALFLRCFDVYVLLRLLNSLCYSTSRSRFGARSRLGALIRLVMLFSPFVRLEYSFNKLCYLLINFCGSYIARLYQKLL